MLLSLTRSSPVMRRTPEWTESASRHTGLTGALFETRPPLRKLIVLADADLLTPPEEFSLTPAALLTGLLTHPYIKLLRYRDDGPYAGAPRTREAAQGWAELLPPDGEKGRDLVYTYDSEGPTYTSVFGTGADCARRDTAAAVYSERDPDVAAGQREHDALAAEVAMAINTDLFITERPYLFDMREPAARGVTLCRTAEALAIVGLYLRSQNEFILWHAADGSGHARANEWLFYQIGAIELLPGLWNWSGLQDHPAGTETHEMLSGLHDSLIQRVQRSLRTRDNFHRAYNLPQRRDAARTMLVELDALLVTLMGAVDTSARFIHLLLAVDGINPHQAAWQKERWRSKLARRSMPLADLFSPGEPLAHTLTILSRLRNTVHGQMIRATLQQDFRGAEAFINLPDEHQQKILASMDGLGGQAGWGARPRPGGSTVIDPGQFVERLFPSVLGLLNEVMTSTPREDHAGQPSRQYSQPRWFSERNRLSVRWQLGIDSERRGQLAGT